MSEIEKEIEKICKRFLYEGQLAKPLTQEILTLINQHYIPKDAPTGYNLVGECEKFANKCPSNCDFPVQCEWLVKNDGQWECVQDGKISRPMTLQELIEVVGKMLDALKEVYKYPEDTELSLIEIQEEVVKSALTLNGCRIEKA